MPRFFAEIIDSQHAIITGGDARHISGPLRMKAGDEILIRDAIQGYRARIQSVSMHEIQVTVLEVDELKNRSDRIVRLALSLIDPKDMETAIRLAAELGVAEIQPVIAARSNIRTVTQKRYARWNDIILEAVKQSQSRTVPAVYPPQSLEAFALESQVAPGWNLIACQDASCSLRDVLNHDVRILIGPEGGFTESELSLLEQHTFKPVNLGGTTLRSVTAAITVAAVLGL